MRTRSAASATPAIPTLTAIPTGYTILPFGNGHWRPLLVVASGDGLWARPLFRELSTDGRCGAVCASQAEALDVIARHQVWRKRQDEVERGMARQAQKGGR